MEQIKGKHWEVYGPVALVQGGIGLVIKVGAALCRVFDTRINIFLLICSRIWCIFTIKLLLTPIDFVRKLLWSQCLGSWPAPDMLSHSSHISPSQEPVYVANVSANETFGLPAASSKCQQWCYNAETQTIFWVGPWAAQMCPHHDVVHCLRGD